MIYDGIKTDWRVYHMEHITIREHQIPVVKNVDVFIAGGGPAGVGAAIQAARSGADVLLAERLFCLGGTMTAGLMSKVVMSDSLAGSNTMTSS